jgi:formylglycine-generating enzyme
MKMAVKNLGIAVLAVMFAFALAGCEEDTESPPPLSTPTGTVINIAEIKGVVVPAYKLTPVTDITQNAQYSGTVKWNKNPTTFDKDTEYTATITLTPKTGYILQGVKANFFTVVGAKSVSNTANSGVITAVFPKTDPKFVTDIKIEKQPSKLIYAQEDALNLSGLTVTLTYNDASKEYNLSSEFFPLKSITTDPEDGEKLDYTKHNGKPIKIAYGKIAYSDLIYTTNNLDINTPTAEDFNISGLTQYYDGSPKVVTITPKQGKSDGVITVKYNGSTTAPSAVGTYTVTFDVVAAANFNAKSGLSAGTLTIEKATPTAEDFEISGLTQEYDGSPKRVSITPKEGKSTGTITVYYEGNGSTIYTKSTTAPSAVGTYTVTFDIAAVTGYNSASGLYAGTLTIIKIEMVSIPAGTFMMGSPASEANRRDNETQHSVTLSGFYMSKYQVTQEQYQAVMGSNPCYFNDNPQTGETQGKRPVECVSWYDALVFCNKLSIKEGLTPAYSISGSTDPTVWGAVPTGSNSDWNAVIIVSGSNGYRLPTEAQWEYACRAGTTTAYNTGDTISDNTGWYDSNSGRKTHEVGKKPANTWGLYDMHGNVWEWCWDWYDYYSSSSVTDPTGAVTGSYRVERGGNWSGNGLDLRSAYRYYYYPSYRYYDFGFRLVRS